MGTFPGSSMVEQEAVNFEVASSSLARGAINKKNAQRALFLLITFLGGRTRTGEASSNAVGG